MIKRLQLREAINVDDLKQRDSIVRRVKRVRALMVQSKHEIDHWNALHPEQLISTDFEDAIIAWCDGKGPLPNLQEPL